MLIKLKINRKNIEKNLEIIKNINPNIIAVLKDDAYGLGIENILPILIENDCRYFSVAYVEEALKIKKIITKKYFHLLDSIKIFTLNFIEENNLKKTIENNIEFTIFSLNQLEKYMKKIEKIQFNNNNIKIHLKLNTGMNRLGFDLEEIEILCKKIKSFEKILNKKNKNLEIVSVFSHISHSENTKETELQIKKFENMLQLFQKYEVQYKYKHIQASPLLFKYKSKYNYDFARIGMAIYGMEPLSNILGLYQTVELSSKIINIKNVKKGEKVSYGTNSLLEKDTKIAIIPIGYAHGFQKQVENKNAYVLIKNEKAFILGEICMDMIIVDVTHIKNVKINDKVIIIGKDIDKEITLLQMSNWAETIQDDILTKWNKGIKKYII